MMALDVMALDEQVANMKWLKGLYPQISSEHVSVGSFSDGSSAVYFSFRVWCFVFEFVFSY